ncbi:MAG TPA: CarD family transcriptional regulator [Candidatus Limnocylindrales bacterium]|nr:CarD family transcriptional regulator [Candidatus Limnocylindrales bacterium]
MLKFKKGDQVVYPLIGQGKVVEVSYKEFYGEKKLFYTLRLEARGVKSIVYLSVESSEKLGLRKAMTREDIPEVMAILQRQTSTEEVILDNKRSSERRTKQIETLRVRGFQGLALVVSDLYSFFQTNSRKPGMENDLYKSSSQELGKELAVALEVDFKEAEKMIREALSQKDQSLQFPQIDLSKDRR